MTMQLVCSIEEMRKVSHTLKQAYQRIGLVPTMGALHEGHLSLIRLAKQHADIVIASIYVNPTQFGPHEDFDQYPRDFERDKNLCQQEGVDIVFSPDSREVYKDLHTVYVIETCITEILEGAVRPDFFQGVLTVVTKLFNMVGPDIAVFGQKDAQQLCAIKQLVENLNFPIKIIEGPIIREPDGLALSSRNVYLSEQERKDALCLCQSLDLAKRLYVDNERSAKGIKQAVSDFVGLVPSAKLDYVEIVDGETFQSAHEVGSTAMIVLAVYIGSTRLIDNAFFRR